MIGFGIERLGLLSLKYPWLTLLLVAIVTPFLAYGATKLEFTSDIREMFRSAEAEFEVLNNVTDQFPAADRDVHVVVEGDDLLTPAGIDVLRNLDSALRDIEGVAEVVSIVSAAQALGDQNALDPQDSAKMSAPAFEEEVRHRLRDHPLIAGRLLSDDGELTVLSVALEGDQRSLDRATRIVRDIRAEAREALEKSALSSRLTGTAVMRDEIVGALIRDQRIFRVAAVLVGLAVCWIFFRSLRYVLIAAAPAGLAITWLLGGMWLLGQEINVLTNVVPTIVLVIVFSDSVHLLFSIRRDLEAGQAPDEAIARAIRRVGPACVLTSLTTVLALSSLMLVAHPFIADFGVTAASGAGTALLATLLVVPALSKIAFTQLGGAASGKPTADPILRALETLCRGAAKLAAAAPRTITFLGIVLAVLAGWAHSLNEPRYRYTDNLSQSNPALRAVNAIENKLGGANQLQVLIEWPEDHSMMSEETLQTIRAVHEAVEETSLFQNVSSLHGVAQWGADGESPSSALLRLMQQGDGAIRDRFISVDNNSALVTAQFPDVPANELVPVLNRLEQKLENLEEERTGTRITATGLAAISGQASYDMIHELNNSLMIAIGIIIVLIGLALRSLTDGLISMLPNILPLLAGGAFLYLTGYGLQFTAVVAFTIGFGLAVDSTIHMLNRYRLVRDTESDVSTALSQTLAAVGPVVIISSLVVAAGLGTALLSDLPLVRLYAMVVVVVLVAALIGDLVLLPALIATAEALRRRVGRHQQEAEKQDTGAETGTGA